MTNSCTDNPCCVSNCTICKDKMFHNSQIVLLLCHYTKFLFFHCGYCRLHQGEIDWACAAPPFGLPHSLLTRDT